MLGLATADQFGLLSLSSLATFIDSADKAVRDAFLSEAISGREVLSRGSGCRMKPAKVEALNQ